MKIPDELKDWLKAIALSIGFILFLVIVIYPETIDLKDLP